MFHSLADAVLINGGCHIVGCGFYTEEDPHPVARTPAASVTAKMLANFFIIFFLVFRLLFFCFKFVCRIFTE